MVTNIVCNHAVTTRAKNSAAMCGAAQWLQVMGQSRHNSQKHNNGCRYGLPHCAAHCAALAACYVVVVVVVAHNVCPVVGGRGHNAPGLLWLLKGNVPVNWCAGPV